MSVQTFTIGTEIDTYRLILRRRSVQGFVIEWYTGVNPEVSLDGQTIQVIIGDRDNPVAIYETEAQANTCVFSLDEEQTDLAFNLYDGLIIRKNAGGESALVNLRVEVGPS